MDQYNKLREMKKTKKGCSSVFSLLAFRN